MIYLLAILLLTAAIAIKFSIGAKKRIMQDVFASDGLEYTDHAIVVGIGDFYCTNDIVFPISLKSWQKSGETIAGVGAENERYKIILHSDLKNESLETIYIKLTADGLLAPNPKLITWTR